MTTHLARVAIPALLLLGAAAWMPLTGTTLCAAAALALTPTATKENQT